ncbi:MAG: response regulator [Bacteroidales bacterium]|nr:response regulator [Bacteroidales bacterium]
MGKIKIILVDDKVVYRNAIKTLLQKLGDVDIIAEASNGAEFLKLLGYNNPDLVFIDIEMPEMNGIEATKAALKINPSLVIIGLSMYDNKKYVNDLIEAGARGYLLKLSDNAQIFRQILRNPKAQVFFSKDISPNKEAEDNLKKTILIADDFENTRFVIEFTLKQAGYEVIKATDGLNALNYFDGRKIDLLVTDLNMPKKDGLELAEAVKRIPAYKSIPILLLTTEINEEKKVKAKQIGITGWIQKPFVIDKFLMFIKKALQ